MKHVRLIKCHMPQNATYTSSRIRTYTGEIIKPKGSTEVQTEYNGQKSRGRIIVIDVNCSNLLGRDILRKINLNRNESLSHWIPIS